MDMVDGKVFGYFLLGENPAVGSAHGRLQRLGLAKLDWLVVRDMTMIESATFWKDAPEIETGEIVTERCPTEVFFMPAASHVEKSGTFTNTQRLLQWRDQAVEPTGDQRSELWFFYHLGWRLKDKLAGSADERDRPLLDLAWDYATEGDEPSGADALRHVSGIDLRTGRAVDGYLDLRADGSTSCGCWIYSGVYADEVNQARRRKSWLEQGADLTGRPALRRAGRLGGFAGLLASLYLLIADLGRPERFHYMLRVAKPSSPMSVGTWILTAYGPGSGLAAAAELLPPSLRASMPGRLLHAAGRPAGLSAAVFAPGVASYTAALLAQTAVPAWHEARRELPFVFAGSAAASGGGLGMLLAPVAEAGPARRLAAAGGGGGTDRLPADRPAARPGNRGVHDRPRAPSAPVVGVLHARRGGPRGVRSPAQPAGRGRGRPGPAGRQRVAALQHPRGRRRVHQRPEIRGGAPA